MAPTFTRIQHSGASKNVNCDHKEMVSVQRPDSVQTIDLLVRGSLGARDHPLSPPFCELFFKAKTLQQVAQA